MIWLLIAWHIFLGGTVVSCVAGGGFKRAGEGFVAALVIVASAATVFALWPE